MQPCHFVACSNVITDIRAKFGIPNSPQSPDIGQNSDGGISDFRISGQSLIKENGHNSWTSDDIDLKLGSVTKLDKRNKTTLKKFADDLMSKKCDVIVIFDLMSKNCDVIVIFPIYSQFGAIWKPDSRRIVCLYIVTFCFTKTENRTKKSLTQLSHYCFE